MITGQAVLIGVLIPITMYYNRYGGYKYARGSLEILS